MGRNIIHVNATAFPIQIERLQEPTLKSYPLVIAPPDERAVIYATSDEARQMGIFPGMPVKTALKRCRDVVVKPSNESLYFRIAGEMNQILGKLSPLIEPVQQGHTFIDMTHTLRLFGGVPKVGRQLESEIKRRLQLAIRIGAASNKLVSRLATYKMADQNFEEVAAGMEENYIAPFRIYLLPLVNRQIQTQMLDLNIQLIGELARIDMSHLTMLFGRLGGSLYNFSHGIDPRPVLPPTRLPGIVELRILTEDTNDIEILVAILLVLLEKAARRLKQQKLTARKLRLFLRYSDYKEDKADLKFPAATDCAQQIFPLAKELLVQAYHRRIRIRQIAVKLWDLKPQSAQLSLFNSDQPDKSKTVLRAMEKIRARFGYDAIQFGRALAAGN